MTMAGWVTGWVRPMVDISAFEERVVDTTLRFRVSSWTAGKQLRVELSNTFGDEPLIVGRTVLTTDDVSVQAAFGGAASTMIGAGECGWSDPVSLEVRPGAEIIVDVYLPGEVLLRSGNFSRIPVEISVAGDHAGAASFRGTSTRMMPAPDGTEMAVPAPFLRSLQTDGEAGRIVACLGDSITAGGWPEIATGLLTDSGAPILLNLGIAGNRMRIDPAPETASFGRAGLTRLGDDVLDIAGITDVVIALGTNDLCLPGGAAPADELPTVEDMIGAYRDLINRVEAAGLAVVVATITPFLGADGVGADRDRIRAAVSTWIRSNAPRVADFDAAVRSEAEPARLADAYDSGDHLHPNDAGERRLAETIAAVFGDRR